MTHLSILPREIERHVLCHCASRMFEVVRYGELGIFLEVVCGGVAMYNRIIKLKTVEIAQFEELGECALYKLAYEVCKGSHSDREWRHA